MVAGLGGLLMALLLCVRVAGLSRGRYCRDWAGRCLLHRQLLPGMGFGLSLRVERRATRRRLWAVLWCDGEHAPLVDIMGDRSRDALSIVGQLLLKGGGHHMHGVICSLASLLAYAAAWQVSSGA